MARGWRIVGGFLLAVGSCAAQSLAVRPAAAAPITLNENQTKAIAREVVPAWRDRNPIAAIKSLSKLAAGMSPEQLAALDQALVDQRLPGTGNLFAQARLALLGTAIESEAPTARPHEVILALPIVRQRIETVLAEIKSGKVMADPLPRPDTLQDYEKLFKEVNQLDAKLDLADSLARFAVKYAKLAGPNPGGEFTGAQTAALATNYSDLAAQAVKLRRDLLEREIELRIQRIDQAYKAVTTDAPLKSKLFAVYALDWDGMRVGEFFENDDLAKARKLDRPRLTVPGLAQDVKRRVEEGRQAAGPLLRKSRLLYAGLQWWLRGRYGTTRGGAGWLKSRESLRSAKDLDPLFMPAGDIEPTDPFDVASSPSPKYERRHHYTWAWESRQFQFTQRHYGGEVVHNAEVTGPGRMQQM